MFLCAYLLSLYLHRNCNLAILPFFHPVVCLWLSLEKSVNLKPDRPSFARVSAWASPSPGSPAAGPLAWARPVTCLVSWMVVLVSTYRFRFYIRVFEHFELILHLVQSSGRDLVLHRASRFSGARGERVWRSVDPLYLPSSFQRTRGPVAPLGCSAYGTAGSPSRVLR